MFHILRRALCATLTLLPLVPVAPPVLAQSNPLAGRTIEYQAEYRLLLADGTDTLVTNCQAGRVRFTQTGAFWEDELIVGGCGSTDRPGVGFEIPMNGSGRTNHACEARQGQRNVACSNGYAYRLNEPARANSRVVTTGTVSSRLRGQSLRLEADETQREAGQPDWSSEHDMTFRLTNGGCTIETYEMVTRRDGAMFIRHRFTGTRSCTLR